MLSLRAAAHCTKGMGRDVNWTNLRLQQRVYV